MAEITVRSEFVLKLTEDELRLVGLGLAGKLKGKDVPDAIALGVRLAEQRTKYLSDMVGVARGRLEVAVREAAEAAAARDREVGLARAGTQHQKETADGG